MSTPAAGPGIPRLDDPVSAAWNALAGVYDPELYLDVVSLGLVYGVRIDDGVLVVEMTMTTPGCPVSESLPEEAGPRWGRRPGTACRSTSGSCGIRRGIRR